MTLQGVGSSPTRVFASFVIRLLQGVCIIQFFFPFDGSQSSQFRDCICIGLMRNTVVMEVLVSSIQTCEQVSLTELLVDQLNCIFHTIPSVSCETELANMVKLSARNGNPNMVIWWPGALMCQKSEVPTEMWPACSCRPQNSLVVGSGLQFEGPRNEMVRC